MASHDTRLDGLLVFEPKVFEDARGYFFESWNAASFTSTHPEAPPFVQDNQSGSKRAVLRGLHYQLPPHPQGKLVRVVQGAVFDVAVDIRRSSPTFGAWFGLELSSDNRNQLWISPGFAHGFVTLTDWAEVLYKATDYFDPDLDRSIRWDDPDIGVEWPLESAPILSDKDASAPLLKDAEVFP